MHFHSGWGRHLCPNSLFCPVVQPWPGGQVQTGITLADPSSRESWVGSEIQGRSSCLLVLWMQGLPSQAKPLPAFWEGWGPGQALAVPWWDTAKRKLLGITGKEGERSHLYSWLLMGETVSSKREVGSGQLAPGWWQQAWEGDPWAPASVFGRKAATDGVSQCDCWVLFKGLERFNNDALSHFLFHITPGKMENINETLEVNGAWSRLKCVKNFSQEICLFGPFLPFHRHNLPGCVLFIFPWLSLFLFNP